MLLRRGLTLALLVAVGLCAARASSDYSEAAWEVAPDLHWRARVIQIAVSSSLYRESPYVKYGSDVEGALRRSLDTWARAANIQFTLVQTDKVSVSAAGPSGDGVNLLTIAATPENVLLFTKGATNIAATTRVFYNARGQISEADIVLSPYQQFSTDGTIGTYDLESIFTHEIGHMLGLGHSTILGSTMLESNGKNGIYGLQSFSGRTLSPSDVAAVRALYGPPANVTDCCGRLSGKLTYSSGRPARGTEVWAEDSSSGSVLAKGETGSDGTFRFEGLPFAKYRIFAQSTSEAGFRSQEVGEAEVSAVETLATLRKVGAANGDLRVTYLGFNGQLSDLPVSLSPGRSYRIYFGGHFPDGQRLTVGTTSKYFTVLQNTFVRHDYGPDLDVVSVEIALKPGTPAGDYSVYFETEKGSRETLVGGLSVDVFVNNFGTFTALDY